ncbi:hypothetical protein ACH3VR_07800 [Microbacterium sp. B2969]|uniref:Integrase n=1 Tax=Microbacterium alkaliflavum TaxID=3248839 RepID=A0ABW7Q5Y9_9MICO
MRTGRPPLELGTHGKITTRAVGNGRTCAIARLRLWDGELHRVTATADAAPAARALLELRIAERLRLSELDAWRYLTPRDPFDELVYVWLEDHTWCSEVSAATRAACERIVRTQLAPAFGDLAIGEVSVERIEQHVDTQRASSEAAAVSSRDVIELLLDFAVGEGVLIANPMEAVSGARAPSGLGDLDAYRRLVRGRIDLRREEQLRDGGRADG